MSAVKHTPGPWRAAGVMVETAATAHPMDIADCDTLDVEQGEANACLIAAAPDLLAALEMAAAWLHDPADATGHFERLADEFHRDTGFVRPGKDVAAAAHQDAMACDIAWNEWRVAKAAKVLATARAALAKARGE